MDYLKIGKIVNTRGIKGELKVKSLTDFQMDRYKKGHLVFIYFQEKYIEFKVKKYHHHKGMDLLTFEGFEDINVVEKYKGCDIFASADDEITLQEGEFHLNEIVDMNVFQAEKHIGKVVDVKGFPQGDYLVIEKLDGEERLIPFRDEFVLNIDLDNDTIDIIEMEGLL